MNLKIRNKIRDKESVSYKVNNNKIKLKSINQNCK